MVRFPITVNQFGIIMALCLGHVMNILGVFPSTDHGRNIYTPCTNEKAEKVLYIFSNKMHKHMFLNTK